MKNLLALIIFASAVAGWYFYDQFKKMKAGLDEAVKNIEAYEGTVAGRRAEMQAIIGALELQKKVEFRKAEVAALKTKADQARAETVNLGREKVAAVTEARQKQVGRVFTEFVLADGRKLLNVRVTKVDNTGVAVTSASGVTKLRPSELTPEMRALFFY
ncbi:MAG TPA: hypothetical protein DIT64_19530 [Verrucomicrobiales bacterium]|nr:hypothetical protein [Verrucomicrobiales bacterium]